MGPPAAGDGAGHRRICGELIMAALRDHAQPGPRSMSRGPHELDPERLGDHLDRLYRAAWGLCGSREDAEDLVQETYAKVLRKPRLLRSEDDLGYLLRVLRNTHFSNHRAAGRRLRPDPLPEDPDLIEDLALVGPQDALDASELFALISRLPDHFREALVAVDLLGLSYREAARALRVREATITTRLHRGRVRLARALDGKDPDPPGVIITRAP